MATASIPKKRMSPEEYLAAERIAQLKSEYFNGEMFAMSGGSPHHALITANLTSSVHAGLKVTTCRAFSSDLKVRSADQTLFSYPDLTVICGQTVTHDAVEDVVLNPTVVFEVLSPSTEAYDRGRKFFQYQTIESLQDYVLVSQDVPRVEIYSRQLGGQWLLRSAAGLESTIDVKSINVCLNLSDVYDGIAFSDGEVATLRNT